MTYEILLIVVIGGIGSISGSCIGSFFVHRVLGVVAAVFWTTRRISARSRSLLLRTGFRMVVFSVIIMIVVLFFRKGIMGTRELSLAGLADRLRKELREGRKTGMSTPVLHGSISRCSLAASLPSTTCPWISIPARSSL